MNGNFLIKLKAIFLLVVFSTNTLLGFGSAVQINLGFNAGNNHQHNKEKEGLSKTTIACLKDDHGLNNQEVKYYINGNIENENDKTVTLNDNDEEGNYCNNYLVNIVKANKSLIHPTTLILAVFYILFLSSF